MDHQDSNPQELTNHQTISLIKEATTSKAPLLHTEVDKAEAELVNLKDLPSKDQALKVAHTKDIKVKAKAKNDFVN